MLETQIAKILEYYVDIGIDELIDESPRDYFVTPQELQKAQSPQIPVEHKEKPKPATQPKIVNLSLAGIITQAKELADAATNLDQLKAAVLQFEGCAIKRTAQNTVFSDGNPASSLMLIGEAPGEEEDRQGIPFCGASGQLLDKMLAAIAYNRSNCYITDSIFWRPPGNRQPTSEEITICKPFLEKHIALIDPELIVLVGGVAAKSLLGVNESISRLRGKNYTYKTPYSDKQYPVAIIYHPSYLLRSPINKKATWQDLLEIRKKLLKP